MRFHCQNLTDGRLPTWRHGRCWWGQFHAEWGIFYRPSFNVGFGTGYGDGEAYFVRLYLLLFSLFLSWSPKRWRESKDRECSVSVHGGSVWVKPWVDDWNDWRPDREKPWWAKTHAFHVADWILGRPKFSEEKGEPFEVLVPMPEGCYRAVFTPEVCTWRFRFHRKVRRGHEIEIPGGIPFEGKGENSWDCGEDALMAMGCGEDVEEGIGRVGRYLAVN